MARVLPARWGSDIFQRRNWYWAIDLHTYMEIYFWRNVLIAKSLYGFKLMKFSHILSDFIWFHSTHCMLQCGQPPLRAFSTSARLFAIFYCVLITFPRELWRRAGNISVYAQFLNKLMLLDASGYKDTTTMNTPHRTRSRSWHQWRGINLHLLNFTISTVSTRSR